MIKKTDINLGFWVAFQYGNLPHLITLHKVINLEEKSFRATRVHNDDGTTYGYQDFFYDDPKLFHIATTRYWLLKLGFKEHNDIFTYPAENWDGELPVVQNRYNFRIHQVGDRFNLCISYPCDFPIDITSLNDLQYYMYTEDLKIPE